MGSSCDHSVAFGLEHDSGPVAFGLEHDSGPVAFGLDDDSRSLTVRRPEYDLAAAVMSGSAAKSAAGSRECRVTFAGRSLLPRRSVTMGDRG